MYPDKVALMQVRAKAPGEERRRRERGKSLNFAGAGIWLMPSKRRREGGIEGERDRRAKGLSASLARLSFRVLASPPFSRLFIIRANKVSQQAGGLERREGVVGVGEGARATGLNKIIKRLKEFPRSPTCPGYLLPALSVPSTLAAISRRILARESEREKGRKRPLRRILREHEREGGRKGGCRRPRARGMEGEMEISPGRLLCAAMKTACLKEPRRIHF